MLAPADILDHLTVAFERWLGRQLPPRHRRIVATIEMLRRTPGEEPRLYIHDDGSEGDAITRLLVDYLRWLDLHKNPHHEHTALLSRSARHARTLLPRRSRTFYCGSTIRPESLRGANFLNLLSLNADRIPNDDRYRQLRSLLEACCYRSVVIIHGNARRWSKPFAREFYRWSNMTDGRFLTLQAQPLPAYLIRRHLSDAPAFRRGQNPWRPNILAFHHPHLLTPDQRKKYARLFGIPILTRRHPRTTPRRRLTGAHPRRPQEHNLRRLQECGYVGAQRRLSAPTLPTQINPPTNPVGVQYGSRGCNPRFAYLPDSDRFIGRITLVRRLQECGYVGAQRRLSAPTLPAPSRRSTIFLTIRLGADSPPGISALLQPPQIAPSNLLPIRLAPTTPPPESSAGVRICPQGYLHTPAWPLPPTEPPEEARSWLTPHSCGDTTPPPVMEPRSGDVVGSPTNNYHLITNNYHRRA